MELMTSWFGRSKGQERAANSATVGPVTVIMFSVVSGQRSLWFVEIFPFNLHNLLKSSVKEKSNATSHSNWKCFSITTLLFANKLVRKRFLQLLQLHHFPHQADLRELPLNSPDVLNFNLLLNSPFCLLNNTVISGSF